MSTHIRDEDRIVPLDDETRETALEVVQELNEDGLRVVAVAYREFPTAHRRVSPWPMRAN